MVDATRKSRDVYYTNQFAGTARRDETHLIKKLMYHNCGLIVWCDMAIRSQIELFR